MRHRVRSRKDRCRPRPGLHRHHHRRLHRLRVRQHHRRVHFLGAVGHNHPARLQPRPLLRGRVYGQHRRGSRSRRRVQPLHERPPAICAGATSPIRSRWRPSSPWSWTSPTPSSEPHGLRASRPPSPARRGFILWERVSRHAHTCAFRTDPSPMACGFGCPAWSVPAGPSTSPAMHRPAPPRWSPGTPFRPLSCGVSCRSRPGSSGGHSPVTRLSDPLGRSASPRGAPRCCVLWDRTSWHGRS